jgi:hypothetical protein
MSLLKKSYSMGLLLFLTTSALAQQEDMFNERAGEKLKAMEVAYLTRELDLSPEDAQKFWPVFNKYREQVHNIMADHSLTDPLDRQQKVLDVRKQYRTDFSKLLSADRANKVFPSEDQFRQLVRKEFMRRQMEKREMLGPRKRGY